MCLRVQLVLRPWYETLCDISWLWNVHPFPWAETTACSAHCGIPGAKGVTRARDPKLDVSASKCRVCGYVPCSLHSPVKCVSLNYACYRSTDFSVTNHSSCEAAGRLSQLCQRTREPARTAQRQSAFQTESRKGYCTGRCWQMTPVPTHPRQMQIHV